MENTAPSKNIFKRPLVQSLLGIVVVILLLLGLFYWKSTASFVVIDNSLVSAPMIVIGPETEGILDSVYVKAGDTVVPNEPLAEVGSETLYAKTAGLIISVNNMPGQVFMPGGAVVTMLDPGQLRIVGKIDEDKGLSRLKVGDPAVFTVDAFGSKQFTGVVDEISSTADQTNVVFSISDKRPTNQFNVKVRYDVNLYPEFRNGMSAKLRIYAK